jgi:four helix bundle protein
LDFGFSIQVTLPAGDRVMDEEIFKQRTKKVGLRVIKLVSSLPHTREADVLAKQLIRSGTSVGANYRSACRAKSVADIISKLSSVEEEGDESMYWLELLMESGLVRTKRVWPLYQEFDEIVAMVVASINTLRNRLRNPKAAKRVDNPKSKIQNPKS